MARIIPLPALSHRDLRLLLPWYATGRLTDVERARVEAHLAACAACREDLQTDRRLQAAMRELPFDAEAGWIRLRSRIAEDERAGRGWLRRALRRAGRAPPWAAWALAGALAGQAALAVGLLAFLGGLPPARYETLGGPAPPPGGEIIVAFRPQTREPQLRAALNAADVRLVDGPTAGDAYLVRPGPGGRDSALAILRGRPEVAIAEPLHPVQARPGEAP